VLKRQYSLSTNVSEYEGRIVVVLVTSYTNLIEKGILKLSQVKVKPGKK